MTRAGFSPITADRRDAARIAWVVVGTLVFALMLSGLSFFLLDQPHMAAVGASPAWLVAPGSHERVFGHANHLEVP